MWWEYQVLYIREVSTERKQRCREGEPGAGLSGVDSVAVEGGRINVGHPVTPDTKETNQTRIRCMLVQ
jgi:hypothetical protein